MQEIDMINQQAEVIEQQQDMIKQMGGKIEEQENLINRQIHEIERVKYANREKNKSKSE